MQDFFRFILTVARCLGDIAFHSSTMKQVFLVLMLTISLSRAIPLENEYSLHAVCDNSTMHVSVNFTNAFRGAVYPYRNYFSPECSYTVPIDASVTEVNLPLSLRRCDIKIEESENGTTASTTLVIQMHNLLDSIYDRNISISCEIDSFHPGNETENEDYNPFAAHGLEVSWMDFKNGQVLLGEVGEPTESTLFIVVNVRDDGSSQDMVVQNCIAHTDGNISDTTTLVQLSNYYGCPDASDVLSNFTVVRRENDGVVSIFAYAPIANFSLIASRGGMSVTCGITLCETACPAHCNDTESPVKLPLSDYASKEIVMRSDGAMMPDTLRELNRHNDRPRRTPSRSKRSIASFFSSILRWEFRVTNASVSEGNATNVTSIRVTKGLVAGNAVFGNNAFISSKKPSNLTDSNLLHDQFCMDWETFRFIALMTICLFITIVACYCCYPDKKPKKGQSPFLF